MLFFFVRGSGGGLRWFSFAWGVVCGDGGVTRGGFGDERLCQLARLMGIMGRCPWGEVGGAGQNLLTFSRPLKSCDLSFGLGYGMGVGRVSHGSFLDTLESLGHLAIF